MRSDLASAKAPPIRTSGDPLTEGRDEKRRRSRSAKRRAKRSNKWTTEKDN